MFALAVTRDRIVFLLDPDIHMSKDTFIKLLSEAAEIL